MVKRVAITPEAEKVVDTLKAQQGTLMFHQSGGCCDGSAPMCYPEGEFLLDGSDVKLGDIHGCGFYMSKDQFAYWKHTQLIVDVVKGRGSSFSLEIPMGLRFMTRSRMFTEPELSELEPLAKM